MPQCTAKSKRSGVRCKRAAMHDRNVCYMHGGKTPRGIASSNYKHGRYSKYAPERLLERYHEAEADPELLSLHADIALLDSRLADLLKRVDTGESGSLWKQAKGIFSDFTVYRDQGNTDEMAKCLESLHEIIIKGNLDYSAWSEVESLLQQRRLMSESEQKRLISMQNMVSAERAVVFVYKILDVLKRNILDKKQLSTINDELRLILIAPDPALASHSSATYAGVGNV